MTDDSSSTIEKSFGPEEFADLFGRAATFAVDRCRAEYCEPVPPLKFCFLSRPRRGAAVVIRTTGEMIRELLRPDGSFREWINISPVAVTDDATVLGIDYPERFANRLIVGTLALPFEPFHVLGPALPADWEQGTPVPKVSLPRIEAFAG